MSETLIHKQIIRSNAKYVRLSVNAKGEVIISTPYALSPKKQNNIINDNRAWLDKQLLQFQQHKKTYELPTSIHFPAIDRSWQIAYQPSTQRPKLLQLNENELVIYGEYVNAQVVQLLKKWMLPIAKMHLYPWLREVSLSINLPFQSIVAGNHKSQWGSCSRDKVISLSTNLLFLPEYLVKHVFIHELAHTIHFDHSKAFWDLVAKYDDNWLNNKKKLKKADTFLPKWLKE